jgi:hypothetical protein
MAYELTRRNGSTLVDLDDGVVDNVSSSIKFVGRNVVNYGEIQNENFLHLLENFSNNSAPAVPLSGQIWFDTASLTLRVYNGTTWRQIPEVVYSSTATNQTSGDLWYNSSANQLYVKSGSSYTLIGPNSNSSTTNKLLNPARINGVNFDGSADITITAATNSALLAGSYLIGNNFNGSASVTWTVDVGAVDSPTAFKIVARNSDGDIWYNIGHGASTASRYGDLAEKYLSDQEYEVGTVMSIGGEKEVTASKYGDRAIGVVSSNPGYMMNSELENGTYIALKGRVPVKIQGVVKKGEDLIAADNGKAIVSNTLIKSKVFAIALEDSNDKEVIEALIL